MEPADRGVSIDHTSNGQGQSAAAQEWIGQVVPALEAVHSDRSSNDTRKQATAFLEEAKAHSGAPYYGFRLALDAAQPAVARYYGLSVLEYAIRYQWSDYSDAQRVAVQGWLDQLGEHLDPHDPLYHRSKIAQLWGDVAKRLWPAQWPDMDTRLVNIWHGGPVNKTFVAVVLDGLSEDIFNREDATATLRGSDLSKACVNIFTPLDVLQIHFPHRDIKANVRCGDEGWLTRLGGCLQACAADPTSETEQGTYCIVKVIVAMTSALRWASPVAIAAAQCVPSLRQCLAMPMVSAQMAAIDGLYALYCRTNYQDEEYVSLVCPSYTHESVQLLSKIYRWSTTDASAIDDEKYQLGKKLAEVESRPHLIPESSDLPAFLNLLLEMLASQSLTISIPILHTWTRLLRSDVIGGSDTMLPLIGRLLEICSQRLVRYESFPEDSEDPAILYLNEDLDTQPERHAFLGNYRRYCVQVVEIIVRRKPFEAMYHVLGQVDHSLQTLYHEQPPFQPETYSRSSIPLLRVDSHFTVVEAALRGYMKWTTSHGGNPQKDELERNTMEVNLESWCERLLDMNFEDPLIRKRVLQLGVAFSTSALDKKADFMLKVLKHILMSRPVEKPEYPTYSMAVKELRNDCLQELRRLARKMPDDLIIVYDDLEAKINEIVATQTLEDRQRISFYSFLFIICHRSTTMEPELRERRLSSFVAPIKQAWQNAELNASLESFAGFCQAAGVGRVQQYLVSRRVDEVLDWSTHPLDDDGLAIQKEISDAFKRLPLGPTKGLLGVSVDQVKKGSNPYQMATVLWHDTIPIILPQLLKLLRYSHAFHNMANWSLLPPNMQPVVTRVLTDRFWQAGISTGSKDDFYARVTGTKMTLEGFASSVRGAVRTIRELCYSIIFCMTRLDVHFYGFADLPTPLADAFFTDAQALSSHQFSTMLNVMRYLVDDCPVALREQFLPTIVSRLFTELDLKVNTEWEKLGQRLEMSSGNDNLTDEMKEESILRQLAITSVHMVAGLLDPHRENPPDPSAAQGRPAETDAGRSDEGHKASGGGTTGSPSSTSPNSMRNFVLSSPTILHPLLVFCTHGLQIRDTRSSGIIIRVLTSIIPEFASPTSATHSSIRTHISDSVLKAAITSLHSSYFVDVQKDLAQLIATLYLTYAPLSSLPHQILAGLPTVTEEKLDRTARALFAAHSPRHQRALVLDLLEGVRGVSVSELGKVPVLPAPAATAAATAAKRTSSTGKREDRGAGGGGGGMGRRERSGILDAYASTSTMASGRGVGNPIMDGTGGGGADGDGVAEKERDMAREREREREKREGSVDLGGVQDMFA
ncbi:MAG: hypothetical protein M1838_003702 [Thelocarpon superellum]|nr:MAG: hypothetical protein M1838_003702 [Thelocarpon superellum]